MAAVKLMLAPAPAETTLGILLYAASRFPFNCETELASLFDDCPWIKNLHSPIQSTFAYLIQMFTFIIGQKRALSFCGPSSP